MAVRRGWSQNTINTGNALEQGPKTFWIPGGTETTVVLLDDEPCQCVRHVQYLKGDKKANGMRATCAGMDPVTDPDPVPQKCLMCNAMVRADRIARKHFYYLTIVDERQFEYNGNSYKDMKRLLELTPDAVELFTRRRAAAGSLVGARFRVYRSQNQRAARHGDDWQFLGFVWNQAQNEPAQQGLMRHFWKSPAIPNIRKSAEQRKGPQGQAPTPLSWQEAAQQLITPYDYNDIMGSYDPKVATAFVTYHAQATGQGAGALGANMAGDAPGAPSTGGVPPFPGGAPDYSTQAPATMPTGAAPTQPSYATDQAPPLAGAPGTGDAPPWDPAPMTQSAPAPQPSIPDPASAGGPGYGQQAPAFPGAAQAQAPAFPNAAAQPTVPQTMPANTPVYQAPAAGPPAGASYDFSQPPANAPTGTPAPVGAAGAPPFPGAQGMTGGPSTAAPEEPFGI